MKKILNFNNHKILLFSLIFEENPIQNHEKFIEYL